MPPSITKKESPNSLYKTVLIRNAARYYNKSNNINTCTTAPAENEDLLTISQQQDILPRQPKRPKCLIACDDVPNKGTISIPFVPTVSEHQYNSSIVPNEPAQLIAADNVPDTVSKPFPLSLDQNTPCLEPRAIIYESVVKSCVFLRNNDNDNFAHYDQFLKKCMSNNQNLALQLAMICQQLDEDVASPLKNKSGCCFFFSKPKKQIIPSLTDQFIKAFLNIYSIDCKETAERFQKAVDDLTRVNIESPTYNGSPKTRISSKN